MQILNQTAEIKRLYFLRALGYHFMPQVTNFRDYNSEFLDLEALNREINSCALCSLKKSANSALIGQGDAKSKVMIVSPAPSFSEDQSGERLCGEDGAKICDLIYDGLNLRKGEFYATSVLRCKPGLAGANERCFALCKPYLFEEIKLIKPKIIVALGEEVFLSFYPKSLENKSFESIRGSVLKFENSLLLPAYSQSQIAKNPSLEAIFRQDLKKIKGMI